MTVPLVLAAIAAALYLAAWWWDRFVHPPAEDDDDEDDDDASGSEAARLASIDTVECRKAVHEAGHAIAAWCCTHVRNVDFATIEAANGGSVHYWIVDQDEPDVMWHSLAIRLAGATAESMVFGRSGPATSCKDDFENALKCAVEIGNRPMPWKDPGGPCIAFRKIYRPEVSDEAIAALEAGYRMARHVLQAHGGHYYRVVSMLLTHRTVTQRDMARLLGARSPFFGVLTTGPVRFVLPQNRRKAAP